MKILITGASNGMGKGVARAIAKMANPAHEIILLCRSESLGQLTAKELENLPGKPNVSLVRCDLAKFDDVKEAIQKICSQHSYLDSLFINAGIGYAAERVETQDGMDSHFQVNYLSQFMLTLNLLPLLEQSKHGGRVIFNATNYGEIYWDDIQMTQKWGYERGIYQAMAAKRMLCSQLHHLYSKLDIRNISFTGFSIHKTVWTNQVNIIPPLLKIPARMMKLFGGFISIDECGQVMAPLFTESQAESMKKSGKLITWKKDSFVEMKAKMPAPNQEMLDKLWDLSLSLCKDDPTTQIANGLHPS